MTKREICERLMNIRDYAKLADTWQDDPVRQNVTLRDMLAQIAADLKHILLDLAAPETEEEPEAEEPKAEEKHPGVIAKPGKDGEIEWCWCQKCYAHAAVVHDPFGDGEDWSYCKTCGVSFRLKRAAEARRGC